ncbi:MAG: Lrp/AsnC family transcriptional regulator [Candidatus Marinimicrobia bacterium]|jgi:DNA-binding Lrp family transcriptional regulator|nr:Lrp/AsnC family transcriptional regulator [Candidatus Neomarinimicrobiota bacterium]MBT7831314.1 Lrp/AsnC family transcriptional regulator [Candidatus Neomarinimicrobiota bacterium]
METTELSLQDRRVLNEFQHHFPLSSSPYAELAERLGSSEEEVIGQIKRLKKAGLISRVGAVIQPHTIGYSTLAAMAVPAEKIEAAVKVINRLPQVNHNYEREDEMNLWFVVTAEDEADLEQILTQLESDSGYPVHSFPMVRDFHIDLGFSLDWKHPYSSSNQVHPAAFS